MPGGELEPPVRSGPALSEVAAEFAEIFERAGLGQPAVVQRRSAAVAALRPSRGSGSAATLLIAVAAGLVGLGAGAFVIRTPGPPPASDAKAAIPSQPQPEAKSQPIAPAAPPIALAEASSTLTPEAPAKTSPAAKVPPEKVVPFVPRTARARTQIRAKLARLDGARPAEARPPIRLREPAMPMVQPASCEQDAAGDGCRLAVVQADRHLRAAYQNAIRRGVSRDVLEDYRGRWAGLREQQAENPARLVESYGALAYDLGRESADDEDDAPRPKSRSGLKAIADLLLPWR